MRYKVAIHGSIPVRYQDEIGKLPFSITGEIDTAKLHTGPKQKFEVDGRLKAYGSGGRYLQESNATPVI